MEITKRFELALPPERVWAGLSDIRLVAGCLPGASITDELPGGGYKGRMSVKLGPLSVAFNGEMNVERREAEKVAVVRGKGNDPKSNTRVQATMTYSVKAGPTANAAVVEMVSDIVLSGALAQFGKAAVIQEVAGHMSADFARNFTARMSPAKAAAEQAAAQAPAKELNGFAMAGRVLWSRIKALFGFGSN
jgi:carbon monoxide dehydrogenase subunit G